MKLVSTNGGGAGVPPPPPPPLTPLEVKRRIRNLRDAVRELREVYPRMELGQLDILLSIALDPGAKGTDLMNATTTSGHSKGGFYKALSVLSDERAPGAVEGRVSGLDLITKVTDPADGRAFLLLPTRRGAELMRRLANKMGD